MKFVLAERFLLTWGTSGIGARTAELFVREGARVVIAGRRRERGEELAANFGGEAVGSNTKVT